VAEIDVLGDDFSTRGGVLGPGAMPVDVAWDSFTGNTAIPMSGSDRRPGAWVRVVSPDDDRACAVGNIRKVADEGQVTSVAYVYANLVTLTRHPFGIQIDSEPVALAASNDSPTRFASQLAGWKAFHQDPGVGLACASCHPEGTDDSHTWVFRDGSAAPVERRTPSFGGQLARTAPYHWDGTLATMEDLVHEVMVGRMGAHPDIVDDAASILEWLDTLPEPRPKGARTDLAKAGQVLFERPDIGCADCHSGPDLTTSESVDVGTGEVLQVPSLRGVSNRGPWMHDGCAGTLEARFNVWCGGFTHGNTAYLDDEEIGALVAYLETL
jgi:mono/diheme cytochrome c family protein